MSIQSPKFELPGSQGPAISDLGPDELDDDTNKIRVVSHGGGPALHLFDHWQGIRWRLAIAPRVALLLDFDGTLATIEVRPEQVSIGVSTRRSLEALCRNPRVKIWVVSGRRLPDLRRRVGVRGVRYVGLHGWAAGRDRQPHPATRRLIATAYATLQRSLEGLAGVRIEHKGPILVVHYREANAQAARRARHVAASIVRALTPALRLSPGKKICEILPSEVPGKGLTARIISWRQPEGTLLFYVGDDLADEEAFDALPTAITVHVGRGLRTRARFRLRSPEEVGKLLAMIEEAMA